MHIFYVIICKIIIHKKLIIDLSSDIEIEIDEKQSDGEIKEVPLRWSTRQRSQPDYYGMEKTQVCLKMSVLVQKKKNGKQQWKRR